MDSLQHSPTPDHANPGTWITQVHLDKMTVKTACACRDDHDMEILWKIRMCVCVCVCVSDVLVDARLTVKPSDTTALAGTQVVLRCTTSVSGSPPWIHWIRNIDFDDADYIVYACVVQPGFTSQYSVNSNETGRCDLVITAATPGLAGSYRCTDESDVAVTELTVIGEWCFLFVVCCSTVGLIFISCFGDADCISSRTASVYGLAAAAAAGTADCRPIYCLSLVP